MNEVTWNVPFINAVPPRVCSWSLTILGLFVIFVARYHTWVVSQAAIRCSQSSIVSKPTVRAPGNSNGAALPESVLVRELAHAVNIALQFLLCMGHTANEMAAQENTVSDNFAKRGFILLQPSCKRCTIYVSRLCGL